jgi:molybdopterin/thiamine biosynthesis adenylyltransferase
MSDDPQLLHQLTSRIEALAEPEGDLLVLTFEVVRRLAGEFEVAARVVHRLALQNCILPRRYLRNFGTLGWNGQLTLLQSRVAVIGLGGLGGSVVEALTRSGIGCLVLVDGDVFVDHNLNRQILSGEAQLGRSKTEAALARVSAINSAVEVILFPEMAEAERLPEILSGVDVVVDALDRLPTRLILQDAAAEAGIPLVHGAIAGWTGQVMTVLPGDRGLRALYGEEVPAQGAEVELGCPAATPMMVAAWQVQEVIKLLTGQGSTLRHQLLFMDAEMATVDLLSVGGDVS